MVRRGCALLFVLAGCAAPDAPLAPPLAIRPSDTAPAAVLHRDLPAVAVDLTPFVERLLREHGIPGAAIAVLDAHGGTERRWEQGFGRWRPDRDAPMPADATFRAASISKLVTDLAAMVLVERGLVDLDAPVQHYVPDFVPQNPFDRAVTLRHLMGHRAGVVRESPVGHYFDPGEPPLAATVASLAATALVHEPGSTFKYSNPGIGVVGELIARVHGKPFEVAVHELVLAPLGLLDSDFAPRADLLARQARGVMWTYDGRAIPTPEFAFGYGPAANLRTTVGDLVTFASSWFPDAGTRVLTPTMQHEMWKVPGSANGPGCGLGFFVEPLDGHRTVGHGGAVYGFASELRAMPDEGLAVAVVVTKDFANKVAEAIAERALRVALAARTGATLPPVPELQPLGVARARELAGHYRVGRDWVELYERDGELVYDPNVGVRTRLRLAADGSLVSDDTLSLGGRRLTFTPAGKLHDGTEEYVRDDAMPAPPPDDLLPLLGEYGWDHNVLVVYEDRGQLAVLIEWVVRDLPDRVGPDRYRFLSGMYGGDGLWFERNERGDVVAAVVGGARFARRPEPAPGGFRITPRAPVAELLSAASRATMAAELRTAKRPSELVELAPLEPGLKFELVYATANNFLGTPVYPATARAKLQRPAAEALVRVHRALAAHGFGLWIFDAYRPWQVTKTFWDATPDAMRHFVADPAKGSRHNRGCAVDLTLYELASGQPVAMPSGFDEFTPRAYPDYPGGTSRQRWCRELLRRAMAAEGFTVYEHEWWHFDHGPWRDFRVGDEPL